MILSLWRRQSGFTADTKAALKSLFLLLLEHTGIPESVWGAELGSARATAETQQDQFVKEIQGWRRDAGGWIIKLCKLWLQSKAITDPQIYVGRLSLTWPALVQEDKELRLKYVELGRQESLLTDETTLDLLELVDNPQAEAEAARGEADARQAAMFPDGTDAEFGAAFADAQRLAGEAEPVAQMGDIVAQMRPDVQIVAAVRTLRAKLMEIDA